MTTIRNKLAAIAVALVAAGGLAALSPAGEAVAADSPVVTCVLVERTEHYFPPPHTITSYYECSEGSELIRKETLP